jgi:hypothetical protein
MGGIVVVKSKKSSYQVSHAWILTKNHFAEQVPVHVFPASRSAGCMILTASSWAIGDPRGTGGILRPCFPQMSLASSVFV